MHFLADNTYLLFLVAIPFVIAFQVYFLVLKMSEPEKMFQSLSGLNPAQEQLLVPYWEWLAKNNLVHISTYKFGSIQTIVFAQNGSSRFFSFLFHQQMTFCVETYFDDIDCTCLDTGTSGSIGMFPRRPHQYQQSFPGISPDSAWQRHLEAESYLMGRFGIKSQPLKLPYDQIMLKAIRIRMQFIRRIPFYPFRALYWYGVMRSKMANRSIQQQFP